MLSQSYDELQATLYRLSDQVTNLLAIRGYAKEEELTYLVVDLCVTLTLQHFSKYEESIRIRPESFESMIRQNFKRIEEMY